MQPGQILVEAYEDPRFEGPPVAAVVVERVREWGFRIEEVPAGTYSVRAFVDADADGSPGSTEPQASVDRVQVGAAQGRTEIRLTLIDPDTDADGLPDWWEMAEFEGLAEVDDPAGDADADGYDNEYEYLHRTDPRRCGLLLVPGWNLISIRDPAPASSPAALLGDTVVAPAWVWVQDHYERTQVLDPVLGCWVCRTGTGAVEIPLPATAEPAPTRDTRERYTLELTRGWNLVSIGYPPAENGVSSLLGSGILPPVWVWEDGAYRTALELLPLRGHWVYCPEPAGITVEVEVRGPAP
jgi:hypothetical protein